MYVSYSSSDFLEQWYFLRKHKSMHVWLFAFILMMKTPTDSISIHVKPEN